MEDFFFNSLVLIGLLVLVALALGPVGFFLVIGARGRLLQAEQRIRLLEGQLRDALARPPSAAEPQAAVEPPPVVEPETPPPPPPISPPPPVEQPAPPPPVSVPQVAAAETLPPPVTAPRSLEELLGTRWTVWVGGVALALGGLLLVRYSIEQGWFGPAARIVAGLLFAAALVAGGEFLRRRERGSALDAVSKQTPAILTAAGTVVAFGTIYAAHALYQFIGPGVAFLLLGLLGLATMLAAALHAPWLAGLGLLGAFVAPLLISSDTPAVWPVAIYIGFVTASAYGLARLRLWFWLAIAAAAGGFLWGIAFATGNITTDVLAIVFYGLLQTALAIALFVIGRPHSAPKDEIDPFATLIPSVFAFILLAGLAQAITANAFGFIGLAMAAIAAALLAASGLAVAEAAFLTVASAAVLVAVLVIWPSPAENHLEIGDLVTAPASASSFIAWAFCTVPVLAFAATVRLLRGSSLPRHAPAVHAAVATLPPIIALLIAYSRLHGATDGNLFAACAAALAFVFLIAATIFQNRARAEETGILHFGLGTFAAASLAALSFALVFALDRGMLTVAFALAALGTAYVDRRLAIPALRWGVAVLGGIVAARLIIDPRIVGADLSATPIFNWLLWGYGVPALAFALAAELMRPRGEDPPVHIAQGLAILFAAFLVFFEIRHAINNGDPFAANSSLVEQGLLATASFAYSIVVTRLDMARTNPVLRVASFGLGLISFAFVLIGLLIIANPLLRNVELEGGAVLNALLLGFAMPAVLAFVLARLARGVRPVWYVNGARICSHVLAFAYANLELRRLIQGPDLWLFGPFLKLRTSDTEFYAYSALWLGLGLGYLAYGLIRNSLQARLVSGILIVASVVKVFLLDLAGLEGILRALSFIGLGLVLMIIGLIYQKFVFARRAPAT